MKFIRVLIFGDFFFINKFVVIFVGRVCGRDCIWVNLNIYNKKLLFRKFYFLVVD